MKTIFRRIHGRLIPIHINDEVKEGAKGGGLVGAGVATGVATGLATAKLDLAHHVAKSTSINLAQRAIKLHDAGNVAGALKGANLYSKYAKKADLLAKASTHVGNFGFVATSALIGAGVNKILDQTRLKNDPEIRASVATGTGVAASFAIRSTYASRFFRNVGSFEAVRHAAKIIAKKAIKIV